MTPYHVRFNPITSKEATEASCSPLVRLGIRPKYTTIDCGTCGQPAKARVVAETTTYDYTHVEWCLCPCPVGAACVVLTKGNRPPVQHPTAVTYLSDPAWPEDLRRLYTEAATAYAAGAFTAAAIVARKLLMAVACDQGDGDGKQFAAYVNYITNTVLTFPKARAAIDAIRTIGNDANHKLAFVTPEEAKRAMDVVTYLLKTIYTLPNA